MRNDPEIPAPQEREQSSPISAFSGDGERALLSSRHRKCVTTSITLYSRSLWMYDPDHTGNARALAKASTQPVPRKSRCASLTRTVIIARQQCARWVWFPPGPRYAQPAIQALHLRCSGASSRSSSLFPALQVFIGLRTPLRHPPRDRARMRKLAKVSRDRTATGGGSADGRGAERPARPYRKPGRGSAAPRPATLLMR